MKVTHKKLAAGFAPVQFTVTLETLAEAEVFTRLSMLPATIADKILTEDWLLESRPNAVHLDYEQTVIVLGDLFHPLQEVLDPVE